MGELYQHKYQDIHRRVGDRTVVIPKKTAFEPTEEELEAWKQHLELVKVVKSAANESVPEKEVGEVFHAPQTVDSYEPPEEPPIDEPLIGEKNKPQSIASINDIIEAIEAGEVDTKDVYRFELANRQRKTLLSYLSDKIAGF